MRTKTLYRCDAQKIDISRFPNFHITGSITGNEETLLWQECSIGTLRKLDLQTCQVNPKFIII